MRRTSFPVLFVLCLVIYSCKDNVVCPAFQSTYILDDSIRLSKYSYFANDSTPKFAMVSKRTKYGINKHQTLFRKNYELMTAPKKNVLAPVPEDTLSDDVIDQGDFIAEDFVDTDTLGVDSLATAPLLAKAEESEEPEGPRYKYRYSPDNSYNQEQVYYNKYYGELFIDNRPPPSEEKLEEEQLQQSDSTAVKKKGLGFFKKKKGEKQDEPETAKEEDPLPEEVLPEEEIETTDQPDEDGN